MVCLGHASGYCYNAPMWCVAAVPVSRCKCVGIVSMTVTHTATVVLDASLGTCVPKRYCHLSPMFVRQAQHSTSQHFTLCVLPFKTGAGHPLYAAFLVCTVSALLSVHVGNPSPVFLQCWTLFIIMLVYTCAFFTPVFCISVGWS